MPELPEVETIVRDLRPLLAGAMFTGAWTDWPRVIAHPAPGTFATSIRGRVVEGVGRRAKWVLVELAGGCVLAIQVKMTGQLFVVPAGATLDRHVHLALDLDDGRRLLLRDIRKFARVGLYRRDDTGRLLGTDDVDLFGRHGPEPLDDSFTPAVFRRRLRARRGRLKPLLLDQSFLAGVGNIYADEALWRARLHPLRTVGSLRPADERRLYEAIRGVLVEAVERRGSSVDDYTAPDGDGEMQDHLAAYQRHGLPCLRCGRPLRRIVVGQRGTHFCSWCQRLAAADRAGLGPEARAQVHPAPSSARDRAAVERWRRAAESRRGAVHRGTRWTEIPAGEGVVGLRPGEGQRSSSGIDDVRTGTGDARGPAGDLRSGRAPSTPPGTVAPQA
jgi:formamidopyrimidine-DNA glycosylase